MEAFSIALSGLTAQKQRLAATASNIANVSTAGIIPRADPSAPVSTVYKPLNVSFTSLETNGAGVGVRADVTPDANGYTIVYDPSSSYANSEGLLAVPDIDLTEQIVNLIETKTAFRANVSVIKTQDEMLGELLNTIA